MVELNGKVEGRYKVSEVGVALAAEPSLTGSLSRWALEWKAHGPGWLYTLYTVKKISTCYFPTTIPDQIGHDR